MWGIISFLSITIRWFTGVLGDCDCESTLFWLIFWARSNVICVKRAYFGKGGVQRRRGGLWVSSSAWCEKGMMRKLCKNALRVFKEIKERACVHCCYCLAKPLGLSCNGTVPVIGLYEVKVSKLSEALNKNF